MEIDVSLIQQILHMEHFSLENISEICLILS